jgi:hypothetical protein
MFQCEECISFAICIQKLQCVRNVVYTFKYETYWGYITEKCNYANMIISSRNDYTKFKKLFLKKKGLI